MEKKSNYSQWKFLAVFAVVMGLFASVRHVSGIEIPLNMKSIKAKMKVDNFASIGKKEKVEVKVVNKAHRVRGVWSYAECFPDSQNVQLESAQKYGIMPVKNRQEAEVLVKEHRLVNICHSPFYAIDSLTHSIPYLVPRAQHLLNTICLNFIDSCQVKGLPIHLPIVTSVLRTADDVSNLQRGNKNATTNSCHCYGTTVDIAYNKFMPLTGTYESKADLLRWDEPMKQVLSEVLNDLRLEGKCYVKYERKQGCFHLTCR